MTLQQLKYVITVAETGTITEAANKLYISQPSLTNAMLRPRNLRLHLKSIAAHYVVLHWMKMVNVRNVAIRNNT